MFNLLTDRKDAVFLYGKAEDLILKFESKNYIGNRSIKHTFSNISKNNFLIESPVLNELHIFADFSVSYQTSPKVNVIYSGDDHRSWIDVVVLYISNENQKDISLFDKKYLLHTISESDLKVSLQHKTIINTMPDVKDQVMVFKLGNSPTINRQNISLRITGKSYQSFKMIKTIMENEFTYTNHNLLLRWDVLLQTKAGSVNSLSLQGDSYQLEIYSACAQSKTCLGLDVYWIPNQLSDHRYDKQNRPKPHYCVKHHQMSISEKMLCLNFSSNSIKPNYYVYITSQPQDMFVKSNENSNKVSWNSASSLCQHMGGFLPIIRSKSELDEFIALITFSKYIPPQDKVFIGLSTKISKVRLIFLLIK